MQLYAVLADVLERMESDSLSFWYTCIYIVPVNDFANV